MNLLSDIHIVGIEVTLLHMSFIDLRLSHNADLNRTGTDMYRR